jgi:hypothetical protein
MQTCWTSEICQASRQAFCNCHRAQRRHLEVQNALQKEINVRESGEAVYQQVSCTIGMRLLMQGVTTILSH